MPDDAGLDKARRRPGAPVEAAGDPVRHEALREPRRDGGDPEDSPAEIGAHARSGRRASRPPRLDRRHHERGSRRSAMPGGGRARPGKRREMALRRAHGRGLVQRARGRASTSGGHGMRARRPLRGTGRGTAGERPARPAGHRAVLRDAGRDDLLHQRPAVVGLQAVRLEHRRRVGLRRIPGGARSRHVSRACRSRASPSAVTAACSTTKC